MSDLIAQQGGDEERWAALCQWEMRRAVEHLGETAPLLAEMANYHLGWTDDFAADVRYRGKRIRPLIAMACAAAVGGDEAAVRSAALAAAVELLHNFTLVHDDIQDQSEQRRHRPTVWARWGTAQAINAGDALYAAAHLALLGAAEAGAKAEDVLDLVRGFEATTLEIVSGQVLDLQFESRTDVTPDEYIAMITGKTARIVEYAAGAGAWIGGAGPDIAGDLAGYGMALGIGYQIHDDLLGTFGDASETGKPAGDDIRRKKGSLPVLLLHERGTADERAYIDHAYRSEHVDDAMVEQIIAMMRTHEIEIEMLSRVETYHASALAALERTGLPAERTAFLVTLTTRLQHRTS